MRGGVRDRRSHNKVDGFEWTVPRVNEPKEHHRFPRLLCCALCCLFLLVVVLLGVAGFLLYSSPAVQWFKPAGLLNSDYVPHHDGENIRSEVKPGEASESEEDAGGTFTSFREVAMATKSIGSSIFKPQDRHDRFYPRDDTEELFGGQGRRYSRSKDLMEIDETGMTVDKSQKKLSPYRRPWQEKPRRRKGLAGSVSSNDEDDGDEDDAGTKLRSKRRREPVTGTRRNRRDEEGEAEVDTDGSAEASDDTFSARSQRLSKTGRKKWSRAGAVKKPRYVVSPYKLHHQEKCPHAEEKVAKANFLFAETLTMTSMKMRKTTAVVLQRGKHGLLGARR